MIVAGRQRRRHVGEVLRHPDHHREDVLADALRVRARRIEDLDSALGRGVDVDLVVADPVPADHLEVLARNPCSAASISPPVRMTRASASTTSHRSVSGFERGGDPEFGSFAQQVHPCFMHGCG